jgi:hypothetical protein
MTDYADTFTETYGETEQERRARTNGTGPPIRFKLTPFEQIQLSTEPSYVVKGIIPREGLIVIWGPPKCGKSFWTYDLMMHVALGRPYRGRRVQHGSVVYLALEGGGGFTKRVVAWRQRYLDGHGEPVPFYLFGRPLDIIANHATLIADIEAQTPRPSVVVIDTLNRGLNGSENDDKDMGRFIRAADAIRSAFGCAVIIVHHCGVAASRPRGHTSLTGACDTQIAVERDEQGNITAKIEFMKDDESGATIASKLERVEVGADSDGDTLASCVIVPVDADAINASNAAGKRLTANQARFLDILRDAMDDVPVQHKASVQGHHAVSREWVKICCKAQGWFDPEASDANNRAKVSNMLNGLAGKHVVGLTSLFVWLAK